MNNISEMLLNKIFRKCVSVSHGLQSVPNVFFTKLWFSNLWKTHIDEMADLIRDEIWWIFIELDANNLIKVSTLREKPSNSLYSLLRATGVDDERSSFHKDFKIRGFISEKGQKDKLSSVLRAITPGLYLRNVLETTENLTFSRLMKFLQSHFVERNTTDLCQHLSSITQGSQETAAQFVYRAMSLRQKLIVLLKSPAAEINYDQNLVQRLFLKSLETRLTSKTIVTEIKPLLRNPRVSDEELIFAVGQASSNDH